MSKQQLQILIIEDDEAMLRFLADFIEELGHVPHVAFDKLDAETILRDRRIDAIIMDVFIRKEHSPKLDNTLGILAAIRYGLKSDLSLDRNMPVLVISGGIEIDGGYSPLRMAKDMGAFHTLKKPFSEHDIRDWVDSIAQARVAAMQQMQFETSCCFASFAILKRTIRQLFQHSLAFVGWITDLP